jgi:hypothetical protein
MDRNEVEVRSGCARLPRWRWRARRSRGNARIALAQAGTRQPRTQEGAATIEARSGARSRAATFEEMRDHVRHRGHSGATPGEHGVHIHEKETAARRTLPPPVPTSTRPKAIHGGPGKARTTRVTSGNIMAVRTARDC